MPRAVGIDLGTTNSVVARPRGWRAQRHRERRGLPHDPVGRRVHQGRRGAGRRDRQAPGRHQRRPHHLLRQAPHGHRLEDPGDRRQEVHAAGGLRPHPAEAQARRRAVPGRLRDRRRHHGPRVLQRRRAPGHEGGRRDRGPQRAPHHQRAHRGGPRLRPRQGQGGRAHPRLRPRRRHVRRVPPRGGQGRRLLDHPGALHRRRQPPRRRRLGPAPRRVLHQAVQGHHRCRRLGRQDRPAAPQGGRRAGEEGALVLDEHEHQPAVPVAHRERPRVALDETITRAKFEDLTEDLLDRTKKPFDGRHPRGRHQGRPTSTTWCSSAARPACPP